MAYAKLICLQFGVLKSQNSVKNIKKYQRTLKNVRQPTTQNKKASLRSFGHQVIKIWELCREAMV